MIEGREDQAELERLKVLDRLLIFRKRGCASNNYDAIYKQALEDMRKPDFHAI